MIILRDNTRILVSVRGILDIFSRIYHSGDYKTKYDISENAVSDIYEPCYALAFQYTKHSSGLQLTILGRRRDQPVARIDFQD